MPKEGAAATEKTQAWILFDDTTLYFAARLYDSEPDRIVANEMRHDSVNIFNGGDSMTLVLDTFHDRRNGVLFQTNPLGAQSDQAIADGQYIESWNTVWYVKSARFDGGWSTEMVIPFKSLRYRQRPDQVWSINVRRVVRWRNETSFISPVPASYGGPGATRFNVAATLVGVEAPSRSRNLELKPYVIGGVTTNNLATPAVHHDPSGDFGFDAKYGLTRSLTTDFTYNKIGRAHV